ncbi:hypothetical protein OJAV_G00009370 [Oryzias javanicus]|uniref:Nocturnin n=1 Tax=Oryzias javanicus TaxID=123683 RepID=A0A437DP04_ORYJA|nr:hypothetical protein OJAV_G00009370 [Oryzias javanicus]
MQTMAVCPMGGGATRLYSTLTQSLGSNSSPRPYLGPHHLDVTNLDPDFHQQQNGSSVRPPDPEELLRQCEEALRDRPPRLHRQFVHLNNGNGAPHSPIRVMQWNILAQALGEGVDNFVRCPVDALCWSQRKCLLLEEILTYRPHILCLQEVDHYYDTFEPVLAGLGYSGHFCPKPYSPCLDVEGNNGPDGCALFFDRSRFELLDSTSTRLYAIMIPTNQVAVVTTLRCRITGNYVCVAVTHLKARSGWEWLRSAQGSDLLWQLQNLTNKLSVGLGDDSIPLLICGDFNAVPTEEVYRHFAVSPLGLDSAYKKLSQDGSTEPKYTSWKIRATGNAAPLWTTSGTQKTP